MSTYAERAELIRRTYDAFNRRDIDSVLSTLDPDVDWPNVLDHVRIHGREAVREYWQRQFREIDPHVEPTEFIPSGDEVIVGVHQVVRDREGGLLSDSHIAHAYTFRGDLVLRMEIYPTIDHARRASESTQGDDLAA